MTKPAFNSIQLILDKLPKLALARPHGALPGRLTGLFKELAKPEPHAEFFEIEDLIWAIWADHPDQAMADRMHSAIAAIAARKHDEAEALLGALVHDAPDWAEAYNKRATLFYVMHADTQSLGDIARTLDLEPRHFGALAGFGEICLRHGEPEAAAAGFTAALAINPHLHGIEALLLQLRGADRKYLH